MKYRLYRKEDLNTSKWAGGTTTQLAIFPEDSVYLERNFLWRLSTATCDLDESNFSKLPDYDRVLMVLKGNVVLAHEDVRVAKLGELEQDSFDGGYKTRSFGKITDYNLMVGKGNKGTLEPIALQAENQKLKTERNPEYSIYTNGFYCRDGFATVTCGGKTIMVNQDEQLVVDFDEGESCDISVMGEGTLIWAQIFANYDEASMRPTAIPKEKASFGDFKTCIYLANVQFRGAKHIFKNLKNQWFDEELSAAIAKVENLYLTFFVGLFGLAAVALLGVDRLSKGGWIAAMIIWLVLDIFLVSPAIYMAVVPKPVKKHIKNLADLTPYEEEVRRKQIETNKRLDRIMKKYKHTGKAVYDENNQRLDKTFK